MGRMLRLPEVMKITSMKRSTIYLYMKKNQFPRQVKLTERSVAWREEDIQKYLDERVVNKYI